MQGMQSDLLSRLLSASALRARVIAGNIANQSTPGFTRQVVQFEDLLARKMKDDPNGVKNVQPLVVNDELTPRGPDGNNVQLELELNSMRENRILYETYASILSGKMEIMRASIESSN